jgi:serine/threonine-protein kinase
MEPLEPGSLDGRVELRERLGEGGMGEVHAAWDRSLDRPVAVKFVRGSDPRDAERLLLEARLQARVEHPHVVRVFEVGSLQGRPCILFQLVRGRTLADLAASLSIADRVELVRQAATGLHAAHQEGLVHRDVKPANILVEEGEGGSRTALVTDFGLAHVEEGGLTRSGLLPGTLDYMAPEQLAGTGPVEFRSDVYALGATLYAVLAGRPPFRIPSARTEAGGEEQVKLLRRILDEEPPPLRSVAAEAPRELSLIAGKAMEKEAGARYPSAEAFAEDLSRFQRGEPVRARPATLSERAWKWARRNPTAARALGAALAVLLLAGGFTLWLSRRAGAEALEAARLGAVASSLESRMRMEYLSLPHDLRPALAAVKSEVEQLRPLAARRGGGPASFALGKGLDLLGDLDGARAAYERAWALGFRTPQVAEGLGTVLGLIYQRERERAYDHLGSSEREARIEALRRELRDPARRYLAGSAAGGRETYLRAQTALLDEEYPRARELAAAALAADPGRYEARGVEGKAWLAEARVLDRSDRLGDAATALGRAVPAVEEALKAGRSDPDLVLLLAEIHYRTAKALLARGGDPTAEVDRSLALLERAAGLVPDSPRLVLLRGWALGQGARQALFSGRPEGLRLTEEANEALRQAARAAPADVEPKLHLALGLYLEAVARHHLRPPATAPLAEGLEVSRTGLSLAPRNPAVLRARAVLLMLQAQILQDEGRDGAELLREVDRLCEEAVRLDPRGANLYRETQAVALGSLGRDEWRSGLDPRPSFRRAVALGEGLLRETQGRRSAAGQLAETLAAYALVLLDMGEDPKQEAQRAIELFDQRIGEGAPQPVLLFTKAAQGLGLEAVRRASVGEDPAAIVAEARRLIAAATRETREVGDIEGALGGLHLAEARGLAARGRDPREALARARRTFEAVTARRPAAPEARAGLVSCALEGALWLRRRGHAAADEARRGLPLAQEALGADPQNPQLRVLLARLQGLAGDRAAARVELDRAYARQPLVKSSREARAAEAELAAAAAAAAGR